MTKIFISYRREDSKHAVGRLHAALARRVRNPKRDIFIDIDNIPRGVDFVDHLDAQVAQCDVMLAVIGPNWLLAKDAKSGSRRLDDPHDFVRIEIASALKRGIPVVPVVLDETQIPVAADLPADLQLLARRNGERLEHESFDDDVARLIDNLPTTRPRSSTGSAKASKGKANWIGPAVAAIVLVIGAGAWAVLANGGGGSEATPVETTMIAEADVPPPAVTQPQEAATNDPAPVSSPREVESKPAVVENKPVVTTPPPAPVQAAPVPATPVQAAVVKPPVSSSAPYGGWTYRINPANQWETKCVDPSGVEKGVYRNCSADQNCNRAERIIKRCQMRESLIKDDWDYEVDPAKGRERWTMCINPSGEFVGSWRKCDDDNVCGQGQKIIAMCRSTYGG